MYSKRGGYMKLKKWMMPAAALMMAGALVFSGCSSKNADTGSEAAADDSSENELKLGEYKGITATVEVPADVTEEDVKNTVMASVENATVTQEIKDRAVEQGDTVNVDYTGYMDDKEIPDSSAEDYNIRIGSGVFFNGAESNLIGAMPGDTVDISVTYPEGYPQKDLEGKNAVYKVTVNYIAGEQQAELTDEFVASISDCKTVEEYEQMVRKSLEESRENELEVNRENAVWTVVLDNARMVSYSNSEVAEICDTYKSYDESAARDFGMTMEDYVQTYQNMSIDEYNAAIEDLAKQEIKKRMVVDAIAQAENIDGENMTDEEIERCAKKQNYDSVEDYKNTTDEEDMKEDVKGIRVTDFIVNAASITETPASVEES